MFVINDNESYNDFKTYLNESPTIIKVEGNIIYTSEYTVEIEDSYKELLDLAKNMLPVDTIYENKLIYGKDKTEGIVAIEVKDNDIWLFFNNGSIDKIPAKFWICAHEKLDKHFMRLQGNSYYKFVRVFSDNKEYRKYCNMYKNRDIFVVYNNEESQMISKGITLFKGLKVQDVSVLSFDIEGSGLVRDENSKVFVITNTLYKDGVIGVTQFREDHYSNIGEMIDDWCLWVRTVDPTVINGHNVFGYDLDYLRHVAGLYGTKLYLGKDASEAKFSKNTKNYRVDGSQTWEYHDCRIFGRHVIDGMFLAVKHDIGRNYPNWGLKAIAEYEKLVAPDRQFYDASKIKDSWYDLVEREKIVNYCRDDGNDSYALYNLMIPSLFYMCQSIPKPFQTIINSASGSWLNTIMLRSYLQDFKSIPKSDAPKRVSGGISFGIAGVHNHVFKIDIKSMYPSIMRNYQVNDPLKDPENNFFKMVDHFTIKRFEQKDLYKKTNDKYYDDLQAASKVFINSAYGMLGTQGLNFNSFENADFITGMGRQIIRETMNWATGHDIDHWWNEYDLSKDYKYGRVLNLGKYTSYDYVMVNADTDSISFRKKDGSFFDEQTRNNLINEINSILPSMIEYEDDGFFSRVIVVKAKNYVLKEYGTNKIKIKGSSLKDQKKEPALLEMLKLIIQDSLLDEKVCYSDIYTKYIKEALNVTDIKRWAVKKSVTEKLQESERANETKVMDALEGEDYQTGDKIYVFNKIEGEIQKYVKGEPAFYKKTGLPMMIPNRVLKLIDQFDGDYDKNHYVGRVYNTIKILENVIDMDKIINFTLTKYKPLLEKL